MALCGQTLLQSLLQPIRRARKGKVNGSGHGCCNPIIRNLPFRLRLTRRHRSNKRRNVRSCRKLPFNDLTTKG